MKKIVLCVISVLMIFSMVSCSKNIEANQDIVIKSGSGEYVDCSEYVSEIGSSGYYVNTVAPTVKFSSKDEFCSFFKNEDFTSEQIKTMACIALADGKVELPETQKIIGIKFGGEENITQIDWCGGNNYVYTNIGVFEDRDFSFMFKNEFDGEEIEEFMNKKNNEDDYIKKDVYSKNGIRYTEFTVENILDIEMTEQYWSFSGDESTYYVYHSFHDSEGGYPAYSYVKILIENENGYQSVTLQNSVGMDITPEFVKQFEVYSQNIA